MEELLKQFLILDYTPGKLLKYSCPVDIPVQEDLIIVRVGKSVSIIFLYNGAKLVIDWPWIDLFSSLNTWGGDRILDNCVEGDKLSDFISSMLKINNMLTVSVISHDIVDTVLLLSKIGTKKFIEVCKKYNEDLAEKLKPFEFFSTSKNVEI